VQSQLTEIREEKWVKQQAWRQWYSDYR